MKSSWDVVIVGAGHNGQLAAAYLAKNGHNVAVIERREVIDGCASTVIALVSIVISLLNNRDTSFKPLGNSLSQKQPMLASYRTRPKFPNHFVGFLAVHQIRAVTPHETSTFELSYKAIQLAHGNSR